MGGPLVLWPMHGGPPRAHADPTASACGHAGVGGGVGGYLGAPQHAVLELHHHCQVFGGVRLHEGHGLGSALELRA